MSNGFRCQKAFSFERQTGDLYTRKQFIKSSRFDVNFSSRWNARQICDGDLLSPLSIVDLSFNFTCATSRLCTDFHLTFTVLRQRFFFIYLNIHNFLIMLTHRHKGYCSSLLPFDQASSCKFFLLLVLAAVGSQCRAFQINHRTRDGLLSNRVLGIAFPPDDYGNRDCHRII